MAEKVAMPRRIYANPLSPEICTILSLGIYLSCFISLPLSCRLFEGKDQMSRFGKIFTRGIMNQGCSTLKNKNLGTHSFRKGGSTYVANSSCGLTSNAINVRADWRTGSMQDKYIKYNENGDACIGRVVSGLPYDEAKFATLPPDIVGAEMSIIHAGVQAQFGGQQQMIPRVLEFCLASLIYHYDWIVTHLDPTHSIFQTPIFTDHTLYKSLKPFVSCHCFKSGTMTATGLAINTGLLNSVNDMMEQLEMIMGRLSSIPLETVDGIKRVLEERAIGAGVVTTAGLNDSLKSVVESVLDNRGLLPRNEQTQESEQQRIEAHFWNGAFRLLPHDYKIPITGPLCILHLWHLGDQRLGVPALKRVPPRDFSHVASRKRLCDIRFLSNKVIVSEDSLSIQVINGMWRDFLAEKSENRGVRKRFGQLLWTTVVKNLRKEAHG